MAVVERKELAWRVGGPQGSGVDTAAKMFSYACMYGGLFVFGRREYYSNIMGRHSFYDVRVSHRRLTSHRETVDLLATFEAESLARHAVNVVPGGAIVYNTADADVPFDRITYLDKRYADDLAAYLAERDLPPTTAGLLEDARRRGVQVFAFPYDEVMERLAEQRGIHKSVAQRTINTIAVAISVAMLEFDETTVVKALEKSFPGRQKIIDLNVAAAETTYDYVRNEYDISHFMFRLDRRETDERYILVNGNQAGALGKLAGGLTMQTYYPISPATDESVYLEGHNHFPLRNGGDGAAIIVQTEDELSAITMAAGAALAGARAATATSGPGFALMVEALGWVGTVEVPVVITDYQRGSPSTGMPTRTEQGDLLFAVHAGHGEFPRIVLASGDVEETFYDAAQALNYAEKYQVPVIHLLDKNLASNSVSLPAFDTSKVKIERDLRYNPAEKQHEGTFPRFAITESGISPRAVLGQPGGEHWVTGGEHTVYGRVTEDVTTREQQMEKRMRKLETIRTELSAEEKVKVYGNPDTAFTIISWGSTKGSILEAIERLAKEGIEARFIQVRLLYPFPSEVLSDLLATAQPLVDVELNYSGQLARLLREQMGRDVDHLVVKYNGRPIAGHTLADVLRGIAKGDITDARYVIRNPFE
nr:2-oxoacid:acceptor oxidoreductase subunit alpha [Ardenticatena sp.]